MFEEILPFLKNPNWLSFFSESYNFTKNSDFLFEKL